MRRRATGGSFWKKRTVSGLLIMCAIVDANVVAEVFGCKRPEAGLKFFEWIDDGKARLVTGAS